MERGKCKLCNRDKDLCKSHIIPSSFFRDLGRKQPVVIEFEPSYAKKDQNEYKEPLLCRECEDKVKVYEDYIRALILTPDKIGIKMTDTLNYRYFTGIDYPKLKLFQLSLLWRASVAVQEKYSPVQLNARRNEALRKMLYHEKPCNPALYGCRMQFLYNDEDEEIETADIILFP